MVWKGVISSLTMADVQGKSESGDQAGEVDRGQTMRNLAGNSQVYEFHSIWIRKSLEG